MNWLLLVVLRTQLIQLSNRNVVEILANRLLFVWIHFLWFLNVQMTWKWLICFDSCEKKTILILRNSRSHPSTKYFFRSSQSCLCWLLYLQVTSRTPSAIDTDKHKFTFRFHPSKYKRGFEWLRNRYETLGSVVFFKKVFSIPVYLNHSLSIESSHGSQCIHRFKLRKVFK